MMTSLSAMAVIALVYAAGDLISSKTKALCSMLFVSGLIFLLGFWLGLPRTLFADSQLIPVAMSFISVLMVHMGSMLKLEELKVQWKAVVIALASICAAAAGLWLLASPFIGHEYAIAAAGPVSGGVVATLIMGEVATARGLDALGLFLTLIVVLQGFIGMPIASSCLLREARNLKAQCNGQEISKIDSAQQHRPLINLPSSCQTPYILIAKTFGVAWGSVTLAGTLGGVVHPFVMALLAGILCRQIGLLEDRILEKAGVANMLLFVILVPVFMSLNKATPHMVLQLLWPLAVAFVAALAGILALAWPLTKLLRLSLPMTLALSVTCLFGFPGTWVIASEVATQVGETPEEKAWLLDRLLPPMLISGFTSVTIASVILAGFLVRFM